MNHATGVRPDASLGVVKFRAGESSARAVKAPRREYFTTGQQSRCLRVTGSSQAAGVRPFASRRVVEFRAGE